jgi:hypothetical protein
MTIEHDENVEHYDYEDHHESWITSIKDMLRMRNVLSRTTKLRNISVLSIMSIERSEY